MGRSNEGRLYVGRLSHRTRERDLERVFSPFGRIREILLKSGFAFVEFEDHRDAEDACYDLNGRDLLGDRILVEMAKGTERGRGGLPMRGSRADKGWMDKYGPFKRTDYRVVVKNLSTRVSWQDLKDLMRKVGCEVCYADAHKHQRNEAVIEFASRSDMKRAIQKYDGHEVNGRKMEVVEDRRSRSRSGSRSRSKRSRSRSRSRRSDTRSRSASPPSRKRARSTSRSPSRSRDRSAERARSGSRATSRSPTRNSNEENGTSRRSISKDSPRKSDRSRSKSKSVSRSRSRSRSESKGRRSASRSSSRGRHNGDD